MAYHDRWNTKTTTKDLYSDEDSLNCLQDTHIKFRFELSSINGFGSKFLSVKIYIYIFF